MLLKTSYVTQNLYGLKGYNMQKHKHKYYKHVNVLL